MTYTLNCKGRLLTINRPVVMGILNITPDSFFPESRVGDKSYLLKKAHQMIAEGASILDIGGQSTRPGSEAITAETELSRVIESIIALRKEFPAIYISIDTYHAQVAKEAVSAGADMVNDISAGSLDKNMLSTVASLNVPYVLMHMKGTPLTMQQEAVYENVCREVLDFFIAKKQRLNEVGIKDVIIDPGFGFGKTISQNYELLNHLSVFQLLNAPVLLGISRKSMIYKTLGINAQDALNGTSVLHTLGLVNGASILRAHDVKEAMECIKLVEASYK